MPVSMMVPLKVNRSTIAAQRRGSVNVLVQPENDSLLAMAMEFFSSRSVRTLEEEFGPAADQLHVAELVNLCGYPHKSTHAEPATMPRCLLPAVRLTGAVLVSSKTGFAGYRHSSTGRSLIVGATVLPRRRRTAVPGTRKKAGRLWPQVEGYRTWLTRRGYTPGTVRNMLQDLGQVGLWLSAEGLETEDLSEERVALFLAARRKAGRKRVPGPRAMVPLLSYLREVGTVPERRPPVTPLDALLASYRLWLIEERGLAQTTVRRYANTARRFLDESSAGGVFAPGALTGEDINAFLLREFARVSAGSAKGRWPSCGRSCAFFTCKASPG